MSVLEIQQPDAGAAAHNARRDGAVALYPIPSLSSQAGRRKPATGNRALRAVPTADSAEFAHSVSQRAAIRADVEAAFSPRTGRAMLTSLGAPAKATAVGTRNAAGVAVDLDKVLTLVVKALSALLLVAVLAVAGLMVGSLFLASPGDVLVVQPGDTLWSIASTVTNAPDISAVVADIRDLNNLGSDALTVGQSIELPAY